MPDRAIRQIGQRGRAVTFKWFRSAFMADGNLKDSLKFGHAIIDTEPKLDQYLYTYSPIIES